MKTFSLHKLALPILGLLCVLLVALRPAQATVTFKLRNDLGQSVRLHVGTGETTLNNGILREFESEEGTKFYRVEGARKTLLFVVEEEMDGNTFKLSSF
jgi:hypothetical protein